MKKVPVLLCVLFLLLVNHISGLIWRDWHWGEEMLQGRNEYLTTYLGIGINGKMKLYSWAFFLLSESGYFIAYVHCDGAEKC
jgi:hypothetical protein